MLNFTDNYRHLDSWKRAENLKRGEIACKTNATVN